MRCFCVPLGVEQGVVQTSMNLQLSLSLGSIKCGQAFCMEIALIFFFHY